MKKESSGTRATIMKTNRSGGGAGAVSFLRRRHTPDLSTL